MSSTERILCADVQDGQAEILWTLNPEDVFRLRIEVLAEFVAKVGVDVLVADDLDGIVATNRSVVGGQYHLVAHFGNRTEEVERRGMFHPGASQGAVGGLVVSQFAHSLDFGAGMAQHIDEVDDDDVERVALEALQTCHEFLAITVLVDLVIRKFVMFAETVELRLDEWRLVEVLAVLFVFVHPKVGEHSCNLVGHQAAEDGIACILRGCGEHGAIDILLYSKIRREEGLHGLPLVETEIVDDDEEKFLAGIEQWEDAFLEKGGRHQGRIVLGFVLRVGQRSRVGRRGLLDESLHPVLVIALHKLVEGSIGLFLLHLQH